MCKREKDKCELYFGVGSTNVDDYLHSDWESKYEKNLRFQIMDLSLL